MIDRYDYEFGNDMVCDGRGVIPCISLLRMTVVTCLSSGNYVSLNPACLSATYWRIQFRR